MSGHQIMMVPTLFNLLEPGLRKVQSLRWVFCEFCLTYSCDCHKTPWLFFALNKG